MKKRIVEMLLGITLTAVLFTGCKNNDNADYAGTTIYGQVNEIGENSITIEIGRKKEMEKPDTANTEKEEVSDDSTEETSENDKAEREMPQGDMQQIGGMNAGLELTGETCEIEIEDDTVITRQTMGGQMNGQPGEMGEKPEGSEDSDVPEMSEGAAEDEAPTKPNGQEMSEMPQRMESDSTEEIKFTDIEEGDTVSISFDEDGNVEEIVVMSMQNDQMSAGGVDSYDAVEEYSTDTEIKNETISSTGTDENAIHIFDGAEAILKNLTITRESGDSTGGDNSSFYGVGAAVLNTEGTAYISDTTITSDAAGGAGIFSYGDGVTYVSDAKITTKQDTSGGIHVAGGGTLYAWNMDIETSGESSAAIRSDRGSGTMIVNGGTYVSNGVGSPAIYSTADIAVNNASLTANGSEAACIEGLNSIHLYNSDISGNMADNEQNDCTWNVILYQSMSGDSEVGNSTFQMQGGSLTAENGGMFYTTNTESTFIISDVDIMYANDSEFFFKCTGNTNQRGWGKEGSNGADCLFTAISQEMQGDIIWDSISELDFYITDNSSLTGAVIDDESCAGDGGEGFCNLYLGEGCTWTVTDNSTLSNLHCEGTIQDTEGKTVTIKGNNGKIYVKGDSDISITVESYEDSVDISGAAKLADWSDYEVEKPSQLN